MLGEWRTHAEYQSHVSAGLAPYARPGHCPLLEHEDVISKLFILDLDPMKPVVAPLYSGTGRASNFQPEIFRTFVMMSRMGVPISKWKRKLDLSPVLRTAAGFHEGRVPGTASFYDFMNRVYALDDRPREKPVKRKPKKKLAKGEKMPPKHTGVVERLVGWILKGRRLDSRPERFLQAIFARVCADASVSAGLVPQTLTVSGDGTCMATGAAPHGKRTCKCGVQGIHRCGCPRRFSDPGASWGWDSHNGRYFYGYAGYFLSAYDKLSKTDLPLYLKFVGAQRHDSVSAVAALAEFRDMHPGLKIETFLSDSASDNMPTYELLEAWDVNAVIALNGKRGGKHGSRRPPPSGRTACPSAPPGAGWSTEARPGRPAVHAPNGAAPAKPSKAGRNPARPVKAAPGLPTGGRSTRSRDGTSASSRGSRAAHPSGSSR
jgi:hypothetical protein